MGVNRIGKGQACRTPSVSEQSYYRWRKEYGGLRTDQAKRLKDLEKENGRLRKAISDLTLDKLILKEAFRNLSTTLRHRRFLFTDSFLLLWKWRVG